MLRFLGALCAAVLIPQAAAASTIQAYREHLFKFGPLADLTKSPPELILFLNKVEQACGQVLAISGLRNTKVRGTKRVSLHAKGLAIDYQVADTTCALMQAKDFKGGHTTDYTKVTPNHFHISWAPGSREYGKKFTHYGGKTFAEMITARKKAAAAKRKKKARKK